MLSDRAVRSLRRQKFLSALTAWLVYAVVIALLRFYFRYKIADFEAFRRKVRSALKRGAFPVVWAANHLTMVDSFVVFWAATPWHGIFGRASLPWSTPEIENYYYLGSWPKRMLIRVLMYLCRSIPISRSGEGEEAHRKRQEVFDKCAWILKNGGGVFVFPEATRSRRGWFNRHKPKDFLGRLALAAPNADFFCVYLRGERQVYATTLPPKGERFRAEVKVIPALEPGETTPRQVAERLFNVLGDLQDLWFQNARLPRSCSGCDVVDLKSRAVLGHFEGGEADVEWASRHLTAQESAYLQEQPLQNRARVFWKFFAAKEAAYKALFRSGIEVPPNAFKTIAVELFQNKAVHKPTGAQLEIAFPNDDEDKIFCVAVLRGGVIGSDESPGDMLWRLDEIPAGRDPHDFVRENSLGFIAESSDDAASPAAFALGEAGGLPIVLREGRALDLSLSWSHSGRWAGCSFMIPPSLSASPARPGRAELGAFPNSPESS